MLHTPNAPSTLSAPYSDAVQTPEPVNSQHTSEFPTRHKPVEGTSGFHDLELVMVDASKTDSSLSPTFTDKTLSTSSLEISQKNLSSVLQPPQPALEGEFAETPHLAQAEELLAGLSTGSIHKQASQPHQPNTTLDQVSGFWERFNKAADFEDREFVKVLAGNLDTLLIFAGLFSGVNTAFITEALRTIQPDQAKKTNDLMRSVILILQNTTSEHSFHEEPFTATARQVRCTSVFFASLCCSLSAAFGAVLGKQWLNHYEREGVLKPPAGRGRERQKKYEGRSHWHMEGIIETLPTILQVSLFLFLVALVDLMYPINRVVAYVVMGFSLLPALFYIVTTTIATLHPLSPFQTRLSIAIRSICFALSGVPGHLRNYLKDMLKYSLIDMTHSTAIAFNLNNQQAPVKQLGWLCAITSAFILALLCFLWRLATLVPGTLWSFIVVGITMPDPILELKCLIFYAERISSADELCHVIEAIGTLPSDLQVDRSHPIVTSFSETLLKFILKPTWDPSKVGWVIKLTTADARHLLNALHFLYIGWSDLQRPWQSEHAWPYLSRCRTWLQISLWEILKQALDDVSCVSRIADILDIVNVYDNFEPAQSTDLHQELVWDRLQCPSLEDRDCIPYIGLLKFATVYRHFSNLSETTIFAHRLHSTMWIEDQPDLNYPRSRIRAYFLSYILEDTDDDLRFGTYLSACCKRYLDDRQSTSWFTRRQAEASCTYYLDAIFLLLRREECSRWAQQLEDDDYPLLLMQFLQLTWAQDLQGRALLCFVLLWHKRRGTNGAEATSYASVYLTPESVINVVRNMKSMHFVNLSDGHLHQMKPSDVALGIEHVVEYLEAASRLGLLKLGMEPVISSGFREAGTQYPQEGVQLQLRLQERVDALIFS